jgi:Lrp/AsnC family leucine-responsive transcriptional regulator
MTTGFLKGEKTRFVLHPTHLESRRINFELNRSDGEPVRVFVDNAELRDFVETARTTGEGLEFSVIDDELLVPSKGPPVSTEKSLDEIDRKILMELQGDARISYAELGRRVGLTTPAVIERMLKLEDAGIITGYRAEIDTAKVGLPITAFVRMSITGVDYSHIIEVAVSSNEVLECHRGTGGDSFIMKVAVSSVEHLQELIDRLTPYGITTTTIVLSSPVKKRVIDVERQ